jgi:hypothetical protein
VFNAARLRCTCTCTPSGKFAQPSFDVPLFTSRVARREARPGSLCVKPQQNLLEFSKPTRLLVSSSTCSRTTRLIYQRFQLLSLASPKLAAFQDIRQTNILVICSLYVKLWQNICSLYVKPRRKYLRFVRETVAEHLQFVHATARIICSLYVKPRRNLLEFSKLKHLLVSSGTLPCHPSD